jgi:hypothetical protein
MRHEIELIGTGSAFSNPSYRGILQPSHPAVGAGTTHPLCETAAEADATQRLLLHEAIQFPFKVLRRSCRVRPTSAL